MEHLLLFGFGFRDAQRYLLYFDWRKLLRETPARKYNRIVLASRGVGAMLIGIGMMIGSPGTTLVGWAILGTALIAMIGMPCGSHWVNASRTVWVLRNVLVVGLGLWCWSRVFGLVTW